VDSNPDCRETHPETFGKLDHRGLGNQNVMVLNMESSSSGPLAISQLFEQLLGIRSEIVGTIITGNELG
jgi:hypothetical protein